MLDKNKGGGRGGGCRTENISRNKEIQFLFLFPRKHVAKKEGGFHTEFTIPT